LPYAGESEVSESYRAFLGLCSHEYFHTWNVKRIKPDVFLPYDLSTESYTHLLWMFEGITAYYDDLSLARCGLIGAESYLELLGQIITRVHQGSGRQKQSVWDSSFYAWTKFYQQAENAPNAIVSYYTKGSLIALGLDILIREQTGGHKSLDDVMRYLWCEYGKPGKGVNENTIEQEISDLLGIKLADFFERYLRSTEELPLTDWLNDVGVTLTWRAPESSQDKGGKAASVDTDERPWLGVRMTAEPGGVRLMQVLDDGIAQQAGLSAGDLVIALDGLKADQASLEQRVARFQPDQRFRIHAFRRDELMQFECVAKPSPKNVCVLTLQADKPMWLREPN
jgi:predicted metalloprotease with PDZ domain